MSLPVEHPVAVLAILLGVLAGLFGAANHPMGKRFFKIVPLLVFAYFVPTALSNTGVIPVECDLYEFVKDWLLPASLILLTMSVDIPAVLRLGRNQLALFLTGTATIVIGGPLAYLALGWLVPDSLGDQGWKGLAALSGSWIGGGANFVAIGKSVGITEDTYGQMVVVDVVLANIWMAALLFFANNEKRMDEMIGADRRCLDDLRRKSEEFQLQTARPATLPDLFLMLFLAIGGTVVASALGEYIAPPLPPDGPPDTRILNAFAWTVLLATAMGVGISYTPLRKLEGAGAGRIGSVFLYLLVASIGAGANLEEVMNASSLLAIAALWISFHAVVLLILRWRLKAPVFCMAVGSQANIGGAASAPVVAAAFHPALAPVGVLIGVLGYVLGTAAGLLCAFLLQWAASVWG